MLDLDRLFLHICSPSMSSFLSFVSFINDFSPFLCPMVSFSVGVLRNIVVPDMYKALSIHKIRQNTKMPTFYKTLYLVPFSGSRLFSRVSFSGSRLFNPVAFSISRLFSNGLSLSNRFFTTALSLRNRLFNAAPLVSSEGSNFAQTRYIKCPFSWVQGPVTRVYNLCNSR